MKFINILFAILICNSLCLIAKTNTNGNTKKAETTTHANEIGIANNPTYFLKEKEVTYGLHIHYLRSIAKTKFAYGVGLENIFDEHKHFTISAVGSYRPVDKLCLIVSPGVTFEKEAKGGMFSFHSEASYEWELKYFHIGPAAEVAYDPEDYHISLGIHVGFDF